MSDRRAVCWSAAFLSLTITESYANSLSTMFFAQDSFEDSFDGDAASMLLVGITGVSASLAGSMTNGWSSERHGQRSSACAGLLLFNAGIAVMFFAKSAPSLVVGNVMIGFPSGMFANLGITYAADVCSPRVRAYMVAFSNICTLFGQMAATGMLMALAPVPAYWSFRIAAAFTFFAGIGLCVIHWAPESPVWLVRRDRPEEARTSLTRLMKGATPEAIDARFKVIEETNEEEKKIAARVSFKQCFQRENRGKTFRTSLVALCNWASGNTLVGHAPYLLLTTGMGEFYVHAFPLGQTVAGIVATLAGAALLNVAGRRKIWLGGLIACSVVLVGLGFAGIGLGFWEGAPTNEAGSWACGGVVVVYTIVRNFTLGPVGQILYTELPTVRLRQKTIALARSVQFATSMLNAYLLPKLVGYEGLNLSARAGFFFAVLSLVALIASWFHIPETKQQLKEEQERIDMEKVTSLKVLHST